MCPEAVDGTLTEVERRVFEQHVAGCEACAQEYAEAQRGAAWLGVLKGHAPEPPKALLERILAETTGASPAADAIPELVPAIPVPGRTAAPAWALSSVLRRVTEVFRIETGRTTFQPRLAMTAGMAFLSIALTLNMAGVRLSSLRASDFTPTGLRRNVADVGATVARNFQNLRVVYQVESRVSELRGEGPLADRDDTALPQASGAASAQPESQPKAPAVRRKGL
jgi:anti-sigma factor RsiW